MVAPAQRADGGAPVLWHLKVSNFNEKARWALDYKRVPHYRCAAVPGLHRGIARKLGGGDTFPVLVLDGRAYGDSTQIIEALEQRHPDPPLYPTDPSERRRAIELEDFFDEELGPHVRLLTVQHMPPDPELTIWAFFQDVGAARRRAARMAFPVVRRRFVTTLGINERSVAFAWDKLRAAGERFRAELQPSGYLVGESFTVADLTLAALLGPPVAPEQFQYPQPQRGHPLLAPLRDVLAEAGLLDWTREMYARHRRASAEIGR